jgi:hypothetical protein
VRAGEPRRVLDQNLEHRIQVERRAADRLQHLARRRLPLERFLRLVEEAHVLDRDRCLVGESLKQPDLVVRKGADFVPVDSDHPENLSRSDHRYGQYSPDRIDFMCGPIGFRVGSDVVNVQRAGFEHRAPGNSGAPGSDRVLFEEAP